MIGKIIYNLLTTDEVTAPLLNGRVYPVTLPQGLDSTTCVVYQRRMGNIIRCDGGTRIRTESATLWIMSNKYEKIQTIADRVEEIIKPLSGEMQGVYVQDAEVIEESDGFDEDMQLYFLEVVIEMTTIKD